MYLHQDELKKILSVMKKFSGSVAEITQDNSSGIGSITTVRVATEIHNVKGTFEVVITDVESW